MNIFILDEEPKTAALYHCDKHVGTMIKEAAQMMSAAHRKNEKVLDKIYKAGWLKHPCTKWVETSEENYEWLYELYCQLGEQFYLRFGKHHASYKLLKDVLAEVPPDIPCIGLTAFAQAMSDKYRDPSNAITAYRNYYLDLKIVFSSWTSPSKVPAWVIEGLKKKQEDEISVIVTDKEIYIDYFIKQQKVNLRGAK
jgi:hypothetical protein